MAKRLFKSVKKTPVQHSAIPHTPEKTDVLSRMPIVGGFLSDDSVLSSPQQTGGDHSGGRLSLPLLRDMAVAQLQRTGSKRSLEITDAPSTGPSTSILDGFSTPKKQKPTHEDGFFVTVPSTPPKATSPFTPFSMTPEGLSPDQTPIKSVVTGSSTDVGTPPHQPSVMPFQSPSFYLGPTPSASPSLSLSLRPQDMLERNPSYLIQMILEQHKKIQSLNAANEMLAKALNAPPVLKSHMTGCLDKVLGSKGTYESMVDVTFGNKGEGTAHMLGRPTVFGSSTKQMRHVIPVAFFKDMVVSETKRAKSSKDLFNKLFYDFSLIFKHTGIKLSKEEFNTIKFDTEEFAILHCDDYYLIHQPLDPRFVTPNKKSFFSSPSKLVGFDETIPTVYSHAVDVFNTKLHSPNDYITACEHMAEVIHVKYSMQPHVSYPDEGNTCNYEIRYYEPKTIDQSKKSQTYKVMHPSDLETELTTHGVHYFDSKLRIVNNEGSMVAKVQNALSLLNDKEYDEYNKLRNSLSFDHDLAAYDVPVTGTVDSLSKNVAQLLYRVFDFKPLEKVVFVRTGDGTAAVAIKVFDGASGNSEIYCKLMNGREYRDAQRESARGYNKFVHYRTEDTDIKLLTQKIVECVLLVSVAKPNLPRTEILKSFVKLVATAYNLEKPDEFVKEAIQLEKEYIKHAMECVAPYDPLGLDSEVKALFGDDKCVSLESFLEGDHSPVTPSDLTHSGSSVLVGDAALAPV